MHLCSYSLSEKSQVLPLDFIVRDKMSKYYLRFAMCCLSFCSPWQLIQENCNDLQFCRAFGRFKEIGANPSKLGVTLKAKKLPWQNANVLWSTQVVIPSYMDAKFQASYLTTDKELNSDTLPGLKWWFILSPTAVPDWRAVFSHGGAITVTSLTLPLTSPRGCAAWNWTQWTSWNPSGPAECWSERNLQSAWENPAMQGPSISCDCSQTE